MNRLFASGEWRDRWQDGAASKDHAEAEEGYRCTEERDP